MTAFGGLSRRGDGVWRRKPQKGNRRAFFVPHLERERELSSSASNFEAASSTMAAVVRLGRRDEACHLLEMIRELAVFENELEQVKMTEEKLMQDGWPLPEAVAAGAVPRFLVLFAEVDGVPVGFALFFNNYSTWEGLGMYLEDLYVKNNFRGRGIGTQLIKGVAKVAEQRGCQRLQWQVIDFNTRAIKYYQSLGARERVEAPADAFDGKWLNYICDREVICNLAESGQ